MTLPTALGLAISQLLASKMGGMVGVESTRLRGSPFTFAVALGAADQQVDDQVDVKVITLPPTPTIDIELSGVNILLAEDNPVNQQLVRAHLQGTGCRLKIAADGEKALQAFETDTYDIILMDCRMPNLDGFEAAGIIWQHP